MLASTLSSEMLQNLEAKLRQAICWPPSHSLLSPVRAQQLKRKAVHDALVPGQPQHSPAASPGLHQLSCLRKVGRAFSIGIASVAMLSSAPGAAQAADIAQQVLIQDGDVVAIVKALEVAGLQSKVIISKQQQQQQVQTHSETVILIGKQDKAPDLTANIEECELYTLDETDRAVSYYIRIIFCMGFFIVYLLTELSMIHQK